MPPKIEQSSSKSTNTPRSKRSRSSPESCVNPNNKKNPVKNKNMTSGYSQDNSQINMNQLMESMSQLLDSKLSNLASKEDIRFLVNEINVLKKENAQLKAELLAIKKNNLNTQNHVDQLDNKNRRNNLIFKGIKYNSEENNFSKVISDFCDEVLQVQLDQDFLYAFPLGRATAPNRPILVSFMRYKDKSLIMNSLKRLRKTGFVIHQDYGERTRIRRSKLLLIRKEIRRLNNNINVNVRGDHLIILNKRFGWSEDVGLEHGGEDGVKILSDLVGADLSNLISAVRNNTLQKDHFSSNVDLSKNIVTASTVSSRNK